MSGQVKSQSKAFPFFHGTNVRPSGLLPSSLEMPEGSRWHGTPRVDRGVLLITLFMLECRKCLPLLKRQDNPWWPDSSTVALQPLQE